jgi:response regulator NasT
MKTQKKRILLVDDERLVLASYAQQLRAAGFDVVTADSGEEARECAALGRFDLAILDIQLPGVSGIDLARELRDRNSLPFMFVSAYSDSELVKQATALGGVAFLVKPVAGAQLIPAIEAAMARSKDLQALLSLKLNLEQALHQGRHASMAIGMLMLSERISEAESFERLRNDARNHRMRFEEYCSLLIERFCSGVDERLGEQE